ncbi:MAG: F-box protein [Alphaproteobacteria bacterium]|nr:F-box protein [Alphaproteobacteria bacterium]
MIKSIKVLAVTIFIGLGAMPSGFASNLDGDENDYLMRLCYYDSDGSFCVKSVKEEKQAQKVEEKRVCLPSVPEEILSHILAFLPPEQYEEVGVVCKRFYRITRSIESLPSHLHKNILPDRCLSLNLNTLVDLGAILANTRGNKEDRARRMGEFEQKHLVEITTAYRMLKFYYGVLNSKPDMILDKLISSALISLNCFKESEFESQRILAKSYDLINRIQLLICREKFSLLSIKPYLDNCIVTLFPLLICTQPSCLDDVQVPVFIPPVFLPEVFLVANNNDADDDQEDGQ